MWDEQKRSRFQQLRQRQTEGVLEETDQAELGALERELKAAETSYLTPATERLRQERLALEAAESHVGRLDAPKGCPGAKASRVPRGGARRTARDRAPVG